MKFKHAKSPCCKARIRSFGPKRRQCVQCHHTWTIRPKKRGRPAHRTPETLLHRVFVEGLTLKQLFSERTMVGLPAYRYRFRQALRRFVASASPQKIPHGPLVLLVDGLWFRFGDRPWVLYLMALKSCLGAEAVFLDPLLLSGEEGAMSWRKAVATIPDDASSRIRALIADNLPGMKRLAHERKWVLQLCHFHLLLKLQAMRRGARYVLRGGKVRQEIRILIRKALEMPDGRGLSRVMGRLKTLSLTDCGTQRTQSMIREFLKTADYHRAYLNHPELKLPHTTNAVESMGRIIREMFRSSRAGSTPASIRLWATALIRMRPKITCNGHPINRIS